MHYDDPNQDLQDFYFIDPKWLCDLLAKVVTLKQVQNFIKNGILEKKDFPFVFQGERFPEECYPQFIRLLNRFQIACSLDTERVLVTSRLPEEKPSKATNSDLPFVTIKRIHVFPYMPYGFWSRFSARLLHYNKEMLNVSTVISEEPNRRNIHRHSSPFHCEPSCCNCTIRRLHASKMKMGKSNGVELDADKPACEFPDSGSSINGKAKGNLTSCSTRNTQEYESETNECRGEDVEEDTESEEDVGDETDGYAGAKIVDDDVSPSRGGLLVNGIWISNDRGSEFSSWQSDSDSCSSEDEQSSEIGRPSSRRHWEVSPGNEYSSRKYCSEGILKHSSYPAKTSNRVKTDNHSDCSPKSDSVLNSMQRTKQRKNVFPFGGKIPTSPVTAEKLQREGEHNIAVVSEGKPVNGQFPSTTWFVELNSSTDTSQHQQNTCIRKELLANGEACATQSYEKSSSMKSSASPRSLENATQTSEPLSRSQTSRLDDVLPSVLPDNSNAEKVQDCEGETLSSSRNKYDGEATAGRNNARWEEQQSSESSEPSGISQQSISNNSERKDSQAGEHDKFSETSSIEENSFLSRSGIDEYDLSFSSSNRMSSSCMSAERKENGFELNASQSSCTFLPEVFEDPLKEARGTNFDNKECDSLKIENFQELSRKKISNLINSASEDSKSEYFKNKEPELSVSFTSESNSHLPDCPCVADFPIQDLPSLSYDLSKLMDDGFLHCWLSGVCLHHPRLFFMVENVPQAGEKGKHMIVTEVSPNHVGRQVLNYIVDHIDTLIKEWYPDLAGTDGCDPLVQQYIPCNICQRHGLEPSHQFNFVECQAQSEISDFIQCPVHSTPCNLHHIVPDVMMHDVDDDLLLIEEDLEYEEGEASVLGKGGFGKVVRGRCKGMKTSQVKI